MPGSITLPQIVLDLEEEDRKAYEALKPPSSMVVRFGYMRLIGEFPYDAGPDGIKPGCGSKVVVRTHRGIELGEMLTSTCPNAGCSKSISRKQMLEYIEASGGKDYPFFTNGKVLRVATLDDLNQQSRLDNDKTDLIRLAKRLVAELNLPMRIVEVELLLGGERIIFHYTAEQWVDFRELVRTLAHELHTRIEMHQVNARDEARLVADYEKCGQHCCCRQFLKVLKPVSMRSAKVQKATLDPTKISGRCGRLMCCLRYEDETYESLRKKLPNKKSVVETEDGIGFVVDSQILTQLVLVKLDGQAGLAAFPVENIRVLPRDEARAWEQERSRRLAEELQRREERMARRGPRHERPAARQTEPRDRGDSQAPSSGYTNRARSTDASEPRRPQPGRPLEQDEIESAEGEAPEPFEQDIDGGAAEQLADEAPSDPQNPVEGGPRSSSGRRKRRRRRRRGGGGPPPDAPGQPS